ncbi:hypothetical protein [Domibacillus mangrovi]|uniref:ArpU family transcriptional regulator n=1 Tax=Domibacillus mangrovi TaxID=1714354 RepID=A0A1Q5P5S6_9BACI|nr:hypothetical protein [Domibacillus mangrovi]OKL37606.1 hypothetical protein BLL40_04690 [Domibacillus mangrovi]
MEHKLSCVADMREIRKILINEFERYRFYRYTLMPRWEGNEEIPDPTYSPDQQEAINNYCAKIESAVSMLPCRERDLIQERYLSVESEYLTDIEMYQQRMKPTISAAAYRSCKNKAMQKLAFYLGMLIRMDSVDD